MKNGRISRKDNTLLMSYTDENGDISEKKFLPVENVNALYAFGELDYNSKFFVFLAQNEIILHQFNYYGFYSGSFYPREKLVAGELLTRQAGAYLNQGKRLNLAKQFIEGGAFQILYNLNEWKAKAGINKIIQQAEAWRDRMLQAQDITGVMACEAQIRQFYYSAWDIGLDWPEPFQSRTKQPPQNSLNALISFGNMLLYTVILGEIYKTQLNPTISYLHEPGVRRYSLSLDLAELFKPFLVDRLIFRLVNTKMLSLDDFDQELNRCYLNESGKKTFLKAWDELLEKSIKHRGLNRHVSYRYLIRLELYKIIKHLMQEKPYKPFHIWW